MNLTDEAFPVARNSSPRKPVFLAVLWAESTPYLFTLEGKDTIMSPEIINRDEFIVVGVRSVVELGVPTGDNMWTEQFLPRQKEIPDCEHCYYTVFNSIPGAEECGKYECVVGVVGSLEAIPQGMVGWVIPGGRYAQVEAVGQEGAARVFRNIITEWLPDSGYKIASSPLFAFAACEHPESPETVWRLNIPVETPEELEQLKNWGM